MKKLVMVVAAIAALSAFPRAAHADIFDDIQRQFEHMRRQVVRQVDDWQRRHGVKEPMDNAEWEFRRWWERHNPCRRRYDEDYSRGTKETPSTVVDGHTQCQNWTKHPISEPGGFDQP